MHRWIMSPLFRIDSLLFSGEAEAYAVPNRDVRPLRRIYACQILKIPSSALEVSLKSVWRGWP